MTTSDDQQITMHLQEEMDAVVAYGLQQHRLNFPNLYK
jgi:hypothetical protein